MKKVSPVFPAFVLAAWCAAAALPLPAQEQRAFEHIEMYCPSHFGNTYEVFGENEMREALATLKEYGCQWYSDWFDMECCADLATNKLNAFSTVLWQNIRMHYRLAREMGLKTALIIAPNWTYYDQCRGEWKAAEGLEVKIAVTSGFKGANKLMNQIADGTSPYHFIEVMGCPGGCITGGGQPRPK
ncbi:MAG: hypothetical protein IJG25_03960, partial [Thermoguttaceae bacterium]|nr:hypothetical protein [Thermoguttaceae bacterium]